MNETTKRAARIKEFVEECGINYLVHFTRKENLPSIMDHGLLGREDLERRGISYQHNDDQRLDYAPNAICLSITHPNDRLFCKFRDGHNRAAWEVLLLKPEILWMKDCAFCTDNAANRSVSDLRLEERRKLSSLQDMFAGCRDGLPRNFPTNAQAEVLVLQSIEPEFIHARRGGAWYFYWRSGALKYSEPVYYRNRGNVIKCKPENRC